MSVEALELLAAADPGFVVFADLDEFYRDDRRKRSPEVDFGVWWTLPGQDWPRWRVSWVEATGEVYAIAEVLPGPRMVVAHGGFPTREAVEVALEGWAEHCHTGGLGWLWARLAGRRSA